MFSEKNKKIRNLIEGMEFKNVKFFPEDYIIRYVYNCNDNDICLDINIYTNKISTIWIYVDFKEVCINSTSTNKQIEFIKKHLKKEYLFYIHKQRKLTIEKLLK